MTSAKKKNMPKDKGADGGVPNLGADALPIDYSTMSMEELLEAIGSAYASRDMKLMGQLSKLYTKQEGEAEKEGG